MIITAGASLAPAVTAQFISENPVQQKIAITVLKDQIEQEAEMTTKIITESEASENVKNPAQKHIDRRM